MLSISTMYVLTGLIMTLSVLSLLLLSLSLQEHSSVVFADHGEEIIISLHDNSTFMPLTSAEGNQVSVFATYELHDGSIVGHPINAVMEVYAPNGTLIRTSSYPDGFIAQSTGGIEGLETTIRDPMVRDVTANVTFSSLDKTEVLSNTIGVSLDLISSADTTTATTTTTTTTPTEEEQEGESDTEDEDTSEDDEDDDIELLFE